MKRSKIRCLVITSFIAGCVCHAYAQVYIGAGYFNRHVFTTPAMPDSRIRSNPAAPTVQIILPEMAAANTALQLYTANGKLLKTISAGHQQIISIRTDALAKGVYM